MYAEEVGLDLVLGEHVAQVAPRLVREPGTLGADSVQEQRAEGLLHSLSSSSSSGGSCDSRTALLACSSASAFVRSPGRFMTYVISAIPAAVTISCHVGVLSV